MHVHLKLEFMYKTANNMQLEYYFILYIFYVFLNDFCVLLCNAIVIITGTVEVRLIYT